jgi:hypothetical protein
MANFSEELYNSYCTYYIINMAITSSKMTGDPRSTHGENKMMETKKKFKRKDHFETLGLNYWALIQCVLDSEGVQRTEQVQG